jgi:hypothetical protein
MKPGAIKQHVPVFVGSTFVDLQSYRDAVRAALDQIEAIARGMEYFGSRPGSPVDECLQVVKSCKIYICIFGMRYGSVPDGHSQSMTHLEYDEAQRVGLPSLVYLIDEQRQAVLPKDIEFGPGAGKLIELKEQLKKRHTVSFFTTPDDLRARILHDLPALLIDIGAEVTQDSIYSDHVDSGELFRNFNALPKMFAGRELLLEMKIVSRFTESQSEDCGALGLEDGASVRGYAQIAEDLDFHVYGERENAIALLDLQTSARLRARIVTAFGTYKRIWWGDDGPITEPDKVKALVIK